MWLDLKLGTAGLEDAKRLSSSPSFLKLADVILANLDRVTVSELLASYLVLRARGQSGKDFGLFLVTTKPGKVMKMSIGIFSAVLQGVLLDEEFRSIVISAIGNSFKL